MKKKYFVSSKDKKDWINFTKNIGEISLKETDIKINNQEIKKTPKLDLHGFSLGESNKKVKDFINKYFDLAYTKLIIVTGKGSRSKSHGNPYVSDKFSLLKNSVPEFITNDISLSKKISKISNANVRDGGEGAIYVFLKKNKITK